MNNREYLNLKSGVLRWLNSMREGKTSFKMNAGADSSIFTSCFALFILDLFNEVSSLSPSEKNIWIDYIRSFQDKHSGYFVPQQSIGASNVKTLPQLTSFSLSALAILQAKPKYDLYFTNQWRSPEDIDEYLRKSGCFTGSQSSGNLAMFLAIFLTWKFESQRDQVALNQLETWFRGHDLTQNPKSGFWGKNVKTDYYYQYQNAFHQYVIYTYWERKINFTEIIVDNVISLQDCEGHFGLLPGGSGCADFDAADILIHLGLQKNYRNRDVIHSLKRLYQIILHDQNADSGFCESNKIPANHSELFKYRNLRYIFSKFPSHLTATRLKCLYTGIETGLKPIQLQWTMFPRMIHQSNLWDTWFRCLTIAEIDTAVNRNNKENAPWNFHKFIGLGYFK